MHTIAPMRVLVVDDDDDSAMSMALLLKHYGHQAAVADGGGAALQKAPLFHPDCMFIDLAMPEVDGLAVAQRLRQTAQFAQTPLVAVSGYVDQKYRTQAFAAGFSHFLAKPYTLDDLRVALKRVLFLRAFNQTPGGDLPSPPVSPP